MNTMQVWIKATDAADQHYTETGHNDFEPFRDALGQAVLCNVCGRRWVDGFVSVPVGHYIYTVEDLGM